MHVNQGCMLHGAGILGDAYVEGAGGSAPGLLLPCLLDRRSAAAVAGFDVQAVAGDGSDGGGDGEGRVGDGRH